MFQTSLSFGSIMIENLRLSIKFGIYSFLNSGVAKTSHILVAQGRRLSRKTNEMCAWEMHIALDRVRSKEFHSFLER